MSISDIFEAMKRRQLLSSELRELFDEIELQRNNVEAARSEAKKYKKEWEEAIKDRNTLTEELLSQTETITTLSNEVNRLTNDLNVSCDEITVITGRCAHLERNLKEANKNLEGSKAHTEVYQKSFTELGLRYDEVHKIKETHLRARMQTDSILRANRVVLIIFTIVFFLFLTFGADNIYYVALYYLTARFLAVMNVILGVGLVYDNYKAGD